MEKSIIDYFDQRNTNNSNGSNNTTSDSVSNGTDRNKVDRRSRKEEIEVGGKDPASLMPADLAKEITASKVDIGEAIGELGSLWSGAKTISKENDMSKYAGNNHKDDEEDEGDE